MSTVVRFRRTIIRLRTAAEMLDRGKWHKCGRQDEGQTAHLLCPYLLAPNAVCDLVVATVMNQDIPIQSIKPNERVGCSPAGS